MSDNVDPDETFGKSHLDLHCLQNPLTFIYGGDIDIRFW